jgi:hypothetical protein
MLKAFRLALPAASLAVIVVGAAPAAQREIESAERDRHGERFLYVCAGDRARREPDFVAVIDFDRSSRNSIRMGFPFGRS